MKQKSQSFLSSLSWRYKLIIVSVIPLLVAVYIFLSFSFALNTQNTKVGQSLSHSEKLQAAATDILVSILQLKSILPSLIAADDKDAIRKYAINAIRETSSIEENAATLLEANPESQDLEDLLRVVKGYKPIELKLIKHAKRNEDEQAIAIFENMTEPINQAIQLSQKIVMNEQAELNTLAEQNNVKSNQIIQNQIIILIVSIIIGGLITGKFIRELLAAITNLNRSLRAFSNGDLSPEIANGYTGEMGQIASNFEQATEAIRHTISGIYHESQSLLEQAGQLEQNAEDSASNSNAILNDSLAASEKVEEVMTGAEANRMRITESADSSEQSQKTSAKTERSLSSCMGQFNQLQSELESLSADVSELTDSAAQIESITNSIAAISEQTNLLALNAAIEAARAGEMGRGFAVVADEVRNLAHGSSDATEEVKSITDKMNLSVKNTVTKLEKTQQLITSSLDSMNEAKDDSILGKQNAQDSKLKLDQVLVDSEAQHESLVFASSVTNALATKVDQNAEKNRQVHALSGELNSAAQRMISLIGKFQHFDK